MRSANIVSGLLKAGVFACVLSGGAAATTTGAQGPEPQPQNYHGAALVTGASEADFGLFLDRLMMAESAGRSHAKNPRSSALGPFQFINSTWLAVMRKHFPEAIEDKSRAQVLALRTDHETARRAAKAFSMDNHDFLVDKGIEPTFGHLRLAFLLGASGAAEVIQAPPERSVRSILGNNVVRANPFMRRMSAADLIARATRDVDPLQVADAKPSEPKDEAPVAQAEPEESAQVARVTPATADTPEATVAEAEVEKTDKTDKAEKSEKATHVAATAPDKPAQPAAETPPTRMATTQPVAESDMGTVRRGERVSVIDVKCDSRLASCKRWIDEQVAKLMKTSGA